MKTPVRNARAAIELALGYAISEGEWDKLRDEGFGRDIEKNDDESGIALSEAVDSIRTDRAIYEHTAALGAIVPRSKPKPSRPTAGTRKGQLGPLERHQIAVTELFAAHAEQMDQDQGFGIAAFRQEALNGRLLSHDQVPGWIKAHAARDERRGGDRQEQSGLSLA
jgi:hypothetical protein